MIQYGIDEERLQAEIYRLGERLRSFPGQVVDAVQDCLAIIYGYAQGNVPIGSGQGAGALAQSMYWKLDDYNLGFGTIGGRVTMMKDGVQKPYAWMREMGGTIYPRPENPIQRLVWTDESGKLIFARSVTQQGSHYMGGALIQSKGEVRDRMRLMLDRTVKFTEAS